MTATCSISLSNHIYIYINKSYDLRFFSSHLVPLFRCKWSQKAQTLDFQLPAFLHCPISGADSLLRGLIVFFCSQGMAMQKTSKPTIYIYIYMRRYLPGMKPVLCWWWWNYKLTLISGGFSKLLQSHAHQICFRRATCFSDRWLANRTRIGNRIHDCPKGQWHFSTCQEANGDSPFSECQWVVLLGVKRR